MKTYYLVTFKDLDNILEKANITLKVKKITDSELGLGFIKISDFLFENSGVIVDPNTEKLRQRFEQTKSLHLSLYHIISIEEVGDDHKGMKFVNDKNNLFPFPTAPN